MKTLNIDLLDGKSISDNMAKYIAKTLSDSANLMEPISLETIRECGKKTMVLVDFDTSDFVGTVTVKRRQWYQSEFKYLYVARRYRGESHGTTLLELAQNKARYDFRTPILQCTTRSENTGVANLLEPKGFVKVNKFRNHRTDNWIYIWQKVIK